jgi:hypothetical protein
MAAATVPKSLERARAAASASWSIAGQRLASFLNVASTPEIDGMTTDAQPPRDFTRGMPFVEQQHDAAPQHRALRRRGRANPPFECGSGGAVEERRRHPHGIRASCARRKNECRAWDDGRDEVRVFFRAAF